MDYTDKIKRKIVSAEKTVIQTMKIMDEGYTKSMLVFKGEKFLGIITNGDLQRAIIAGVAFETPIEKVIDNTTKKYGCIGDDLEAIKGWMLEKRIEYMPMLDGEGDLVDVIFWEDILGDTKKVDNRKIDLPVIIMAGGKGTRLQPLTNVIPKPLIPIGGKTVLEAIMDRFEEIGCTRFFMSVNYKSDMIRFYLDHLDHKYDIEYFKEEKPLGTIGSVSLLKGRFTTPFFVSNCDNLIDQDFRDVYDYHCSNHNDITIVSTVKNFKIPYGVLETGKDGLMTDLKEKPETTFLFNSGVYILNAELIDEIPENEFFHVTQLIEKVRGRGGRVGCFPISEQSWHDMGEWPEYLKMIKVL